ncbi:M23 family metallopeptidase [candidate division KSB1 bacterium]|nr:M23 family metallopeptidase [candidate division KSB1 bacterium]
MHLNRKQLIGLAAAGLLALYGCGKSDFDNRAMKEYAERLKETSSFRYPLDEYFPEIPVTDTDPPKTERRENHHTAEDSFAPPGTPVYAIGDGIISYSGKARGYGWLIIIDHPAENVYSLYGHLSTSRWKKSSGEVKKGDLIAYIGEAEECYTMVSHIHFGLRMGQKADYPRLGNRRWMAGYTNCRPELLGWFHPSEIIGQTDSMRAWHRYIQKREDIKTGRTLLAGDFKITSEKYNEKQDLDQMIKNEFGDNYRLADWNDILTFSTNIEEWADSLGLGEGEENSLLISNDGYRIWLGRQYYISRFNFNKPREYLAHDSINNNFVCLGSWTGLNRHVLAVRK